MADEQPQQHSFLEKFNLPFSTLWDQYKLFLIGFGILILIFKFRSLIIDLLVSDSRKVVSDTVKQDAALKKEENVANDQANQLRKQAEDLGKNKSSVDEDWNKK